MDDRVLGDRLKRRSRSTDATGTEVHGERGTVVIERPARDRPARPSSGDGARDVLTVVYRISRLVFVLLALAVLLGVVFILAPTNDDNVIVRNVLSLADGAAGPFRDVFTVDDDAERELVVNYAFAAVVYLALSVVVGKLPGGRK